MGKSKGGALCVGDEGCPEPIAPKKVIIAPTSSGWGGSEPEERWPQEGDIVWYFGVGEEEDAIVIAGPCVLSLWYGLAGKAHGAATVKIDLVSPTARKVQKLAVRYAKRIRKGGAYFPETIRWVGFEHRPFDSQKRSAPVPTFEVEYGT